MNSLPNTTAALQRNKTTYRVGLLQAKAYRILKMRTSEALKPFGISTAEWAFLGLMYDHGPIRPSDAAIEVGVEPPFITATVGKLNKMRYLNEVTDEADKRSKTITLTEKGNVFVEQTEQAVRKDMRHIIGDVDPTDLKGYLSVLETIIARENAQHGIHSIKK